MLPEKFTDRMKKMLSADEFEAFIDSFGDVTGRYHALRINPLKCDEIPSGIDGLGDGVL